jgi:LmbE family N-acetylglucosaminyl deacetylase
MSSSVASAGRPSVKDLPEPLDVIAVGAHPDDVEIGCGGTLAVLAAQGYRVGIVDLTDGEPTPRSSGPAERLAEAGLEPVGDTGQGTAHWFSVPTGSNKKMFMRLAVTRP